MARLFLRHSAALAVLYADLERAAESRADAFVGTAGSVVERKNASGFRFYAHQYYDAEGVKRERYVAGPIGAREADAAAAKMRERVRETKDDVPSLRLLGRESYNVVDARTYATIAALANGGVFAAGGVLVGSHAYGVILNRLGVRAAAYHTEDIDVGRRKTLAFAKPPEGSLLDMLRASGIEYVEVPSLDRKKPPTSFKQRGRALHVDLLAPSRDEGYPTFAAPELRAHALGLPYLAFLLDESQPGAVLGREGCCAVRVPLPERFAIHKLVVSRLRVGRDAKSAKDVAQAVVLCAALSELASGALAAARRRIPVRARAHLARAVADARPQLAEHPRALDELGE